MRYLLISLSLVAICTTSARALTTAPIFGSQMVLQRDMKVPVWGTAAANSDVSLSFAGQTVTGKSDSKGNWRVLLEPMKASAENRNLTIKSGGKELVLEDILVGEVWLGSGQSNMAGRVASYAKNDPTLAEIAGKTFSQIRLREGTAWTEATPATTSKHSAILFAFGERLHREMEVPIGLFYGAVGGTPSGYWIPGETFASSAKIKSALGAFSKTYDRDKALKLHAAKLEKWDAAVAKAKAAGKKARGRKPTAPGEPGSSTRGGKIGGLFDRYIRPHAGFAIRGVLWDQGEARTGILGLDQHTCMSELIRGWRELWGEGDFPFIFVQKPSGFGNAFSNEDPITREGEAFAQLPDINKIGTGQDRFLYVRLMQDNANAWMVPACDLGGTVHPKNKWGYGNRAAEVAAQKVYRKEGVQAYGPIYDSHSVSGSTVTITFKEAGRGLTIKHSDVLQGFALAGEDGNWHWAKAEIQGNDTVVLSSENVPEPKNIRFAYSVNRRWANLFNQDGLPALVFTTE